MAFKINWSPQAIDDLRSVTEFIALDNPLAAERVGPAIFHQTDLLIEHPLLGRMVPERKDPKIRELIQSPYRIIYRVEEDEKLVEIMRIWHGARGEPEIYL